MRLVTQRVEPGAHRRIGEVLGVQIPWQGQRCKQPRARGQGFARYQLVTALGQRREHHERQAGEFVLQAGKKLPHT